MLQNTQALEQKLKNEEIQSLGGLTPESDN